MADFGSWNIGVGDRYAIPKVFLVSSSRAIFSEKILIQSSPGAYVKVTTFAQGRRLKSTFQSSLSCSKCCQSHNHPQTKKKERNELRSKQHDKAPTAAWRKVIEPFYFRKR